MACGTFKAGRHIRESSTLSILKRLHECGAEIVAYDPIAMENTKRQLRSSQIELCANKAVEGADVLVLCTEWNLLRALTPEG